MGEQTLTYTIRQKVFKILGEAFHVYNGNGEVVGSCNQKAFRFREKMVFYTGRDQSSVLFTVEARQVIDFGATYDIALSGGEHLGSLRRKGFRSWLVRDEWTLLDERGGEIGGLQEDSTSMALMRRFVPGMALFSPQVLHMRTDEGREIATFRKRFNPLVHKMDVMVRERDARIDDLFVLASACTFMAIDARQQRQNG